MLQQINKKKYLIYIFSFLILTTFYNQNLNKIKFFKIKDIEIIEQSAIKDQEIKKRLLKKLIFIKNKNIFLLNKNLIIAEIKKNEWISNFSIKKKYPSKLIINFDKAYPIANIVINDEIFFVGSNYKLIKSDNLDKNLPNIFGRPKMANLKKFIDQINLSNLNFKDIKNFYYLKSDRWNIKINKGILIKLPKENNLKSLNLVKEILDNEDILIKDSINLTIKNQAIIR